MLLFAIDKEPRFTKCQRVADQDLLAMVESAAPKAHRPARSNHPLRAQRSMTPLRTG